VYTDTYLVMSDLFENYEEEFKEISVILEQRARDIPTYEGSQKRMEVQKAESELRDLEQIIKKMNLSGRSNPRLVTLIKGYEQDISRLRNSIRKADMSVSQGKDRGELFSGVKLDEVMSGSMHDRERLLNANNKLDKASSDIEYAIQITEDAAKDGIVALEDLDRQADQMRRMREELNDIDTTIGRARRIMKSIGRRAWANKIILGIIALVLVAGIILIIYFKWVSPSSLNPVASTTTGATGSVTTGLTSSSLTSGFSTTSNLSANLTTSTSTSGSGRSLN